METRVCPVPNSLVQYPSAPSSPRRATTLIAYFFSVPTSPSRSNPRTPDSDHFRFGSLVHVNRHHHHHEDHLPVMAYADELFCRGRMLPLKLPPRLQLQSGLGGGARKGGRTVASASSAPVSSRLKIPSSLRRSSSSRASRKDEFDPFVMALEKVRENDSQGRPRRSRSLSPLKWGWGRPRSESMGPDGLQSPTSEAELMGQVKPKPAGRQRIMRFLLKSASFSFRWKATTTITTTNSVERNESGAALLWRPQESIKSKNMKANAAVLRISRGIKSLKPRLFSRTR